MKRNLIISLAIAIFLGGCEKISDDVSDRDYALELLNKRNYTESVEVLKSLVAENPDNDSFKILLATAYGGLGGIDVVDSFKIFAPLLFTDDSLSKKHRKLEAKVNSSSNQEVSPGSKIEKNILSVIDQLLMGFSIFFGKPVAGQAERASLVESLLILSYVGESSPYYIKSKSYSTIVNLIQFINYTRDAFPTLDPDETLTTATLVCAFDPALFIGGLVDSSRYLANATGDLAIVSKLAGRKDADKLQSLNNRIIEITTVYDGYQNSIVALDIALKGVKSSLCQ